MEDGSSHSEAARAYSKYLEGRQEIASYEACKPLDINRLDALQKTDIRGEYFREQWSSDFYIRHADALPPSGSWSAPLT